MVNSAEVEQRGISGVKTQRRLLNVSLGSLIGFLSAAVLFSKNLPQWIPGILRHNPWLFFCLFVVISGILGYIWAITIVPETPVKKRRMPLLNTLFSGAFIGFLTSAVLYSKFLPSWVPVDFISFPALFFLLFTIAGALLSVFWHRNS